VQVTQRGVTEEFKVDNKMCNAILTLLQDDQVSGIILDLIDHTKKTVLPLLEENPHHTNVEWEEDWEEFE